MREQVCSEERNYERGNSFWISLMCLKRSYRGAQRCGGNGFRSSLTIRRTQEGVQNGIVNNLGSLRSSFHKWYSLMQVYLLTLA